MQHCIIEDRRKSLSAGAPCRTCTSRSSSRSRVPIPSVPHAWCFRFRLLRSTGRSFRVAHSLFRPSSTMAADRLGLPRPQKRRLTSSEAAALTTERQRALLSDAKSHAAYLWTNQDVRNSLLWFGRTPFAAPAAAAAATSTDAHQNGNIESSTTAAACPFDLLRSLLHNPGIVEARPEKRSKKRRRQEQGRYGIENDNTVDSGRERARADPPIREVMLGYAAAADESAATSLKYDKSDGGELSTASSSSLSTSALDKLRDDLRDIACARAETCQLSNMFKLTSILKKNDAVECQAKEKWIVAPNTNNLTGLSKTNLCLAVLDRSEEYFLSACTAVATAYASELYNRIVELNIGDKGREDGLCNHNGADNDEPLERASQQLLQKLGTLAMCDRRIMEVYALMLLEPARQAHCRDRKDSSAPKGFSTCISTSIAATSVDIDKACSSALCNKMCSSVLKLAEDCINNEERQQNKEDIILWSLPSPLICAISQNYFPFALAYIQYLLKAAIDAYLDVPRRMAEKVVESMEQSESLKSEGETRCKSNGDMDSCIYRLLELRGTSDRLSSLVEDELTVYCQDNDADIHTGDDGEKELQEQRLAALEMIGEAIRVRGK